MRPLPRSDGPADDAGQAHDRQRSARGVRRRRSGQRQQRDEPCTLQDLPLEGAGQRLAVAQDRLRRGVKRPSAPCSTRPGARPGRRRGCPCGAGRGRALAGRPPLRPERKHDERRRPARAGPRAASSSRSARWISVSVPRGFSMRRQKREPVGEIEPPLDMGERPRRSRRRRSPSGALDRAGWSSRGRSRPREPGRRPRGRRPGCRPGCRGRCAPTLRRASRLQFGLQLEADDPAARHPRGEAERWRPRCRPRHRARVSPGRAGDAAASSTGSIADAIAPRAAGSAARGRRAGGPRLSSSSARPVIGPCFGRAGQPASSAAVGDPRPPSAGAGSRRCCPRCR